MNKMQTRLSTLNKYFLNKNGKQYLIFTIIFSDSNSSFEFNIDQTSINLEEFLNFLINFKNDKKCTFKSTNNNSIESSFEIIYDSDSQTINIINKFLNYKVKSSYEIHLIFQKIKSYLI